MMSDELASKTDWQQGKGVLSPVFEPLFARTSKTKPRLLVSVRSLEEAICALEGGADILDVKEPTHGSLGMASINDIGLISRYPEFASRQIPLSVALGEVIDWTQASTIPPGSEIPTLPSGITFAKLGLSRCANVANWQRTWKQIRFEFEQHSQSQIQWVAVAYADSKAALSPPPFEVLEAAMESRCAGLLIDTWTKSGLTLFDGIDESRLISLANECHSSGLFFALAGKLSLTSMLNLANVPFDVLAIRSAACRGTNRTAELDSTRVREFRSEMTRHFGRASIDSI